MPANELELAYRAPGTLSSAWGPRNCIQNTFLGLDGECLSRVAAKTEAKLPVVARVAAQRHLSGVTGIVAKGWAQKQDAGRGPARITTSTQDYDWQASRHCTNGAQTSVSPKQAVSSAVQSVWPLLSAQFAQSAGGL